MSSASSSSSSVVVATPVVDAPPSPRIEIRGMWLLVHENEFTRLTQIDGVFSTQADAELFVKRNLIWLYNRERQPFRLAKSKFLKATEPTGEFKLVDEAVTLDLLLSDLKRVYHNSGIHEEHFPRLFQFRIRWGRLDPEWQEPRGYSVSLH